MAASTQATTQEKSGSKGRRSLFPWLKRCLPCTTKPRKVEYGSKDSDFDGLIPGEPAANGGLASVSLPALLRPHGTDVARYEVGDPTLQKFRSQVGSLGFDSPSSHDLTKSSSFPTLNSNGSLQRPPRLSDFFGKYVGTPSRLESVDSFVIDDEEFEEDSAWHSAHDTFSPEEGDTSSSDGASEINEDEMVARKGRGFRSNACASFWDDAEIEGKVRVRGPDYLRDKLKLPSGPPPLEVVGMDMFTSVDAVLDIGALPQSMLGQWRELVSEDGQPDKAKFWLVLNVILPGLNASEPVLHIVTYYRPRPDQGWCHPNELLDQGSAPPHVRLLCKLLDPATSNEKRDAVVKFIANVIEAPRLVRWAFGRQVVVKAARLGGLQYVSGHHYFQVNVDARQGSLADLLGRIGMPAAKHIVVDMMMVLEGQEESELPEGVLLGVRHRKMDLARAVSLSRGGDRAPGGGMSEPPCGEC
eukprot:jgi/Mesvir1/13835/Mv15984-RA.1